MNYPAVALFFYLHGKLACVGESGNAFSKSLFDVVKLGLGWKLAPLDRYAQSQIDLGKRLEMGERCITTILIDSAGGWPLQNSR